MRDKLGRFVTGNTGNPNGRPRGSSKNQRLLRERAKERIMRARLDVVLKEMDEQQKQFNALNERRTQVLIDFATGTGDFPIETDMPE